MNTPTSDTMLEELERLEKTLVHIERVKDNCIKLGKALMRRGELDMGRKLIANGYMHDNSKFAGLEWDCLSTKTTPEMLRLAISQHTHSNQHHPEYWTGIQHMPRLYVAELVCDWAARSAEFGTSLHEWIDKTAAAKFKFTHGDPVRATIDEFVGLLCDPPFQGQ